MGTPAARALHLALFAIGAVLYVVFVLPRWWVLTGAIPPTLATTGRIAAGVPIGLAAIPVLQLLKAALRRKPRTPELALRLRAWSAVLYAVAGILILLAAIAEFWLTLPTGGPWLFAVYGAAGAIAVLAFLALYLSFVAEKPPADPKPAKPAKAKKSKSEKKARSRPKPSTKRSRNSRRTDDSSTDVATADPAVEEQSSETDQAHSDVPADAGAGAGAGAEESAGDDTEITDTGTPPAEASAETVAVEVTDEPPSSAALRNVRPTGKRRRRLPR